jgi:SAM-dependent methyltransferase
MSTPLNRVKDLNYDHHRRMAEMYAQLVKSGGIFESERIDEVSYRTLLQSVPHGRDSILELGSASGGQWPLLEEWLAPEGAIFGIDLYEPAVKVAQSRGLPIRVGFVEEMPYEDEMFELVCSRHVMEHLGDVDKGIAEILRVTKPGGYVAHVTPNMDYDNEPAHLNHLNLAEWARRWEDYGVTLLSARRHTFHGGEVHIVGKK